MLRNFKVYIELKKYLYINCSLFLLTHITKRIRHKI